MKAISAYKADVAGGQFPDPSELVTLKSDEESALADFLSDPRR